MAENNAKQLAYGAEYPCMAKIKEEKDEALPTYDTGFVATEMVKISETVNYSEGSFYADNKLSEKVSKINSATLAFDSKGFTETNQALIYGLKIDETSKEMTYDQGAEAPFIGMAFVRELLESNKSYFEGVYYPKCQAILSNDEASTRTESITFSPKSTTLNVFIPKNGQWKITKRFAEIDEAKDWIKTKLNMGSTP